MWVWLKQLPAGEGTTGTAFAFTRMHELRRKGGGAEPQLSENQYAYPAVLLLTVYHNGDAQKKIMELSTINCSTISTVRDFST